MSSVRRRASAVVVTGGRILGFRAEDPYSKKRYFFLPGGEIEKDESVIETAVRETFEETGYRIEVDAEPMLFRAYDFEWNGKVHHSETWFVRGRIADPRPSPVNDAAYNLGVDWLRVEEIDTAFNYHPDILEPVRRLVRLS